MNLRHELKTTDHRKLAMRLMSMSAAERSEKVREYFAGSTTPPITQNGVVWQAEGTYDPATAQLQVTFSASTVDPTNFVVTGWVALTNGTGSGAPGLSCMLGGVSNLTTTSSPASLAGISVYVSQQPSALAPIVVATLVAIPNSGSQSEITLQISTAGTTAK